MWRSAAFGGDRHAIYNSVMASVQLQGATKQEGPTITGRGSTMPGSPYDPATETDPLIVEFVEPNPSTGEAVFKNSRCPVWAVVLNLLAIDHDEERVRGL